MALSEHEQRMFDELERELRGEADQAFAPGRGGRWILGGLFLVVGLAAVVTAVAIQLIILGVVGFAAMLFAVVFATSGSANGAATAKPAKPVKPASSQRSGTFFEDRWDRRDGN
jgi:hypothetical protein